MVSGCLLLVVVAIREWYNVGHRVISLMLCNSNFRSEGMSYEPVIIYR